MRSYHRRTIARGFTLIEVLTTILIAAIVVLAAISGIVFSLRAQKLAREHSLAQRQAAKVIEEARNTSFRYITTSIDSSDTDTDSNLETLQVTIDDNQTDDVADDLLGIATLRIFYKDSSGNLVEADDAIDPGNSTSNLDAIRDYIILQAEVEWESMGKTRQVSLVTHMAP